MAQQKIQLDKFNRVVDSPITRGDPGKPVVGWQWGEQQQFVTKKIKASKGFFTNIYSSQGTQNNGTYLMSAFKDGTLTNNQIIGGMISDADFNTGTINTSLFTNGTFNNGVIGTPALTGGTLNPAVYQAGGSPGINGTFQYVGTLTGTVPSYGTLIFANGLLIAT